MRISGTLHSINLNRVNNFNRVAILTSAVLKKDEKKLKLNFGKMERGMIYALLRSTNVIVEIMGETDPGKLFIYWNENFEKIRLLPYKIQKQPLLVPKS